MCHKVLVFEGPGPRGLAFGYSGRCFIIFRICGSGLGSRNVKELEFELKR